ncbi:MAG: transcriptional regulator [Kosmotoga sp.]|nr:MAG: transcriptional regulator [Kosmotoga sp.]
MKEKQNIEFKKSWRKEYLKTIAAFANTEGGSLYIGIDDKGDALNIKNKEKLLEDLPNIIRNHLQITPSIETENIGGKEVIKISVNKLPFPIYFNGKIFRRAGSTTQEIKNEELTNFLLAKKDKTWDSLPSEAKLDDLDSSIIEEFKELAKNKFPKILTSSNERLLKNLNLLTKEHKVTKAAVLLFGKNPQDYIISAQARVGKFKTKTDIQDTIIASGNLFQQLDTIINAIRKHINVRFEIEGIKREDVWDYPIDALREAIINSLIHRDYLSTAEIQIKIYDNKLWIWNPGRLPEQLNLEDLKQEHSSFPKNPLIASIFYYAGLIEKWGSGTTRIIDSCKAQELPEPDFKEDSGGFSITFFKDIYSQENLRKMGLNDRQIKAVRYIKKNSSINMTIFKKLEPNVTEKTLYRDLQDLKNKKIIKQIGKKKGTSYELF